MSVKGPIIDSTGSFQLFVKSSDMLFINLVINNAQPVIGIVYRSDVYEESRGSNIALRMTLD